MLNQIVLVGRLTKDVQVNKSEKGKQVASLTLAIPRSFKNMNGTYDTDFIECTIFDNIAQNTSEYCHKGDILGVKGNLVPPDNASFIKFVDIQKELFENRPFVERDYNDTEIEKINTLLDKICRVGGY